MQFSDECAKLAWTQEGVLELVTKSLLPSICIMGPEAIAVYSPMTNDMNEVRNKLLSFIPEDYMPELYSIKEMSPYMLDGLTKLCVNDLKKN